MTNYDVVIIGSGFGGQCAAIHLAKHQIDNYIILERRSFTGGTWSQNSYPGAAVDVQSPLYSLSFEPGDWSRMFAKQDELEAYTQAITKKYQLDKKIRVNSNVTKIKWLAPAKCWEVKINNEETILTKFVINASGPLSTPVIPNIQGHETFNGHSFHTNDWDHKVNLADKKVAIMGSGASAAQVIPEIVDRVNQLHVFQRTPHWVRHRWDWVFTSWQRKLLRKRWAYNLLRWVIYWLLEIRIIGFKYSSAVLKLLGEKPALKQLHTQVKDPALLQKLTPNYSIGCKRIIVSSTLYPALTHPNSILHDKQDAISTFTPNGVITTKGDEIELDVMIFATGYDATDEMISYPITGMHNKTLAEFWKDYPRAYLGISAPHFPNLFLVTGPNTGIGHTSALFMIESQMEYIISAITTIGNNGARSIEVTTAAEKDYTEMIHKEMQNTVWQTGNCHSWYKSKSGKVTAMFPGFSFSYRRLCKKFMEHHHKIEM